MKCPNCGADNRDDAALCHLCGSDLGIVCPEYWRPNRSDANFCDKCGCDLRTFRERPHISEDQGRLSPREFRAEQGSGSAPMQEVQDVDLVAHAAFDLFVAYVTKGEYSKVIDRAPRVIILIEKEGGETEFYGKPTNPHSMFHWWNGFCLGMTGQFDEGKPWLEKGLALASELNHPHTLGMNEFFFGYSYCYRGDGEHAVKHVGNCVRHLQESGGDEYLHAATSLLGFGYYHLGELEEALELMTNGINLHSDLGMPSFLSLHHCHLSMAYLETGDLTSAMSHAEQGVQASRDGRKIL